jgi:hypothetical protein
MGCSVGTAIEETALMVIEERVARDGVPTHPAAGEIAKAWL